MTVRECERTSHPRADGKDEFPETTIENAPCTDSLKSVRKLDARQASTISERMALNIFKFFREIDFCETVTVPEPLLPDCLQFAHRLERDLY